MPGSTGVLKRQKHPNSGNAVRYAGCAQAKTDHEYTGGDRYQSTNRQTIEHMQRELTLLLNLCSGTSDELDAETDMGASRFRPRLRKAQRQGSTGGNREK